LAEAEVEYEDIVSTQVDIAFEIVESPIPELVGAHAVIWTTTPWTIPVNQALAYGPEVEYVLLDAHPIRILIAKDLAETVHRRLAASGVLALDAMDPSFRMDDLVWSGKGSDLAGTIVRHPMHRLGGFFAKPRPMLQGDFVTTDSGTGLVHMAPDHGEDDFLLCKAHGIDPVFAVEGDGKYRADWPWLGGQGSVINPKFNAPDGPICSDLREAGALLAASADYAHSYPHSWRSKAKVIFRATPQWFIAMDKPIAAEIDAAEANVEGQGGNGATLRELALDAIQRTRFVPEKGRNRIHAMVEGRPDWVISRQRAWGVPIALYVNKASGDYLRDPAVNARILAAFDAGGADAWFGADHQALLGSDYDAAEWEPQKDILDVWFDSGSTHAFTIEARYGEGVRADLYLEGSDQHRGWFQSSLLESCGTRGRAPYQAVLTHGFALDGQGRKMSKSQGNVVDPLKIIPESGADILRLWVASTDYFEDVRIGKEILAGTSDAYRKLRNTFRYLLGALDGFADSERVAAADMPDLERYILHLLSALDAELKAAVEAFEFNRYARALSEFCNNDLSAFFFDIRKDSLYCDAPTDPKRRAYRTVLDTLFHALVRYAAPILCFTAEEVWATRFPDSGSVHLLEWPEIDAAWADLTLAAQWEELRSLRQVVSAEIEPKRRDKEIGSSLEAKVAIGLPVERERPNLTPEELAELLIVSEAEIDAVAHGPVAVVHRSQYHKCGRCWRLLPEVEEDGDLCGRCEAVVGG
jgi:isoleucyl-tRNA synthetase